MRRNRRRPDPSARRRAAGTLLRRPELVLPFHGDRSAGGPRRASDDSDASDRSGGAQPSRERPHVHWKLSDTFIMIVAALRVMLPYVLVILAAVGAAWGLFLLLFP